MTFAALIKRMSAVLPLTMSLGALAVVFGHIGVFGTVREPDEGAAAHIWQILVVGQLPLIAFFAFTWLPKAPRAAALVLALQAGVLFAAFVPVYALNL